MGIKIATELLDALRNIIVPERSWHIAGSQWVWAEFESAF